MTIIKTGLTLICVALLVVLAAGIYRFNFTNDDIYSSTSSGDIVPHSETHKNTYFSQIERKWFDQYGECKDCTPENGFSANGTVGNIAWRTLTLSLKNDLNESPDSQQVENFFQTHYAHQSTHYKVSANKLDNGFLIHIPLPAEQKDIDFFDARGTLLAHYDVIDLQKDYK